jgi:2-polyprenyl-6-methoxyphenol hydroxylase-like FAD-dependent oxidoreductase
LQRLGLDEAIVSQGSVFERAVTITDRGQILDTMSLADLSHQAGFPSLCCHRALLQQTLVSALEPEQIHLNATCVGVEQDEHGVTASFADGRTERGTLLIGADGIHSVVREHLLGKTPVRYAGYFAYRGMAECQPVELPPGQTTFALGRGTQIGLVPCGPGWVYWFATLNAPADTQPSAAGNKADALNHFNQWAAPIPAIIEATEDSALLRNDIIDRPPTWPWGRDRVTLLGDAIHPTTPNLGQGACQALEDAVILADCLRKQGMQPQSLRHYEQLRRERTAWVVKQSWSLGKVFQWQNPLAMWLRSRLVRSKLGRWQQGSLLEKLLLHDLPALVS